MSLNGSVQFGIISKKKYRGWRLKYPGEGGNQNPAGMPAVCPAREWTGTRWGKYIDPVKMTKEIQWLQWGVIQKKNPDATVDVLERLFAFDIAICNGNGYGDYRDPRVNFVTGERIGYEEPKLMDGILMAGGLYQAEKDGQEIAMYPGVHSIDKNNICDVETAINNNWICRAVSWHDRQGGYGEDFFKPGRIGAFYYAHIISEKATYQADFFEWWDRDYPPDPLKVGG